MAKLAEYRTVADFNPENFELMVMPGLPGEKVYWRNISYDERSGQGSYLMIMEPGTRCNPHRHNGPEEFYVIEGDLVDCDGYAYGAGDFVSLEGGSEHFSISHTGCKLVVTHRGPIDDMTLAELEASA